MGDTDSRVDAYIEQFSEDQQSRLTALRVLIHETVPLVRETIKYAMPTFLYEGDLIYFAAQKKHTGLYPMPSGVAHFAEELLSYQTSKGAIQFPLDRPLPLDLIRRIILFRVEENERSQETKQQRNKKE